MDSFRIKDLYLGIFGSLQGASFNFMRAIHKTFFDYCIENRIYLDSNPIYLIKRKKKAKKLVNPFSDEQIEKIFKKCPVIHRFSYEVFLNTGVRLSELTNLKYQDFNSAKKTLHVKGVSSGGGAKGDKSRDIPLPSLLLKKYETYLSDFRLKQHINSDYVFVNQYGEGISTGAIQGRLRKLTKKLKFRTHAHRFRATYATNLHKSGVSVVIISLLMGHESIETTMSYISVSESEKREAQVKGTYLGKLSQEAKRIEKLNREKEDLVGQINELIKKEESLLNRVRSLDI